MSGLEQELRGLVVEWPETPDLAAGIEARLGRPARRSGWRRPLAVALAALVVAVGAVLTFSPGARSALLDLFGIKGATVTRVDELPEIEDYDPRLDLGEPVSLAEARDAVPFPIRVPAGEEIDEVRLDRRVGSGAVSVVWCCPRVVLTQFRGTATPFAEKLAGPGTRVEYVSVGGSRGVWVAGSPHGVIFRDDRGNVIESRRLARNVLLWERGEVSLRLEGDLSRERALAIAAAVG